MSEIRMIAPCRLILALFAFGTTCYSASPQESFTLRGHDCPIWSLAFSPDGKTLCAGERVIVVWDLATKREEARIKDVDFASVMAYSKDGKKLVVGGWSVNAYELATGIKARLDRKDDAGAHRAVAVSPDGKHVAMESRRNRIWISEFEKDGEGILLSGHREHLTGLAFSPDGTMLASGSFDNTIRLWDVASATEIARFPCESNWMTRVQFTPDGKAFVSGSAGDVKVWDVKSKKVRFRFPHEDVVPTVSISPNGKVLATGCATGEVKLWDLISGKEIWATKHSNMAMAVAFSPDGKLLAIGGGQISDGTEPNEIKLVDVSKFTRGATSK